MKLDKKIAYYLREAHVDFTEFEIIEILPINNDHAAVLLAPKSNGAFRQYFNLQYFETSNYYATLENMMEICVECNFCSRREADRIIKDFYNRKEER